MNAGKQRSLMRLVVGSIGCVMLLAAIAVGQKNQSDAAKTKQVAAKGQIKSQGGPSLKALLVDPQTSAKDKSATVEVNVTGVNLIDPALTNKQPRKNQGHLHYQVDSGPVIATTTKKLSFHGLTPGTHKIVVMLANNDHSPAGPQQTLEIVIP